MNASPSILSLQDEEAAPADLESLARLAAKQQLLEREIEEINALLSEKSEDLKHVAERQIPEIMNQLNVKRYVFGDGSALTLQDIVQVSIPAAKKPESHDWLRTTGHGDLIKNEIIASFATEEDDLAKQALAALKQAGVTAIEKKESVHSSTLKSFVKEQLALGIQFPQDLFSIFQGQRSKITQPKP